MTGEVCEICLGRIEARCAGLDTPALSFCAIHAYEHERNCPEVKAERSWLNWIERSGESEAERIIRQFEEREASRER